MKETSTDSLKNHLLSNSFHNGECRLLHENFYLYLAPQRFASLNNEKSNRNEKI